MGDTKILPRSPTSIASAAALLAGGNLFDHHPPNAQRASMSDIESAFSPNTVLRLGWRTESGGGGEEERFAIYVETDI